MIQKTFPNISWWKNIRVWLACPFMEYGVRLVRAHEHESLPYRLGHLINRVGLSLLWW